LESFTIDGLEEGVVEVEKKESGRKILQEKGAMKKFLRKFQKKNFLSENSLD